MATKAFREPIYRGPTSILPRIFKFALADCNPDSIRAMIARPHDRTPAVAAAVEQVGGALLHAWVTLSEYDTVVVTRLPDEIAANALWNVFKAGAGVVQIAMEPMITLEEHMEALKIGAKIDYLPPQGPTWDRSQFKPAKRSASDKVLYRGAGGRTRLFKVELANCNPDSVRAMLNDPHDRRNVVSAAIKQVGGVLRDAWVTLREYDTLMVIELPDEIAANALWSVFKAGAGVVRVTMEPMITLQEHEEALKLAAQIDYLPPQGETWNPRDVAKAG